MAAENPPGRPVTTFFLWAKAPPLDSILEEGKQLIKSTAIVPQRPDGGAPAWQPWVAATRQEHLEHNQIRELREITGQSRTTPVETLRLEPRLCIITALMRKSLK